MRMTRFSRGAVEGFSLIEILVAITIAFALLSIAWVRMSTLAPIYRLEGSARALAAEIQKARGRAIAEGKCVRVLFDISAKTYRVDTASGIPLCSGANFTPGTALKIDDNGRIAIDDGSGNTPVSAIFNPRGGSEATGGAYPTIRLSNEAGAARLVLVNSAGRVSVQ
jgi:Tfp pilus assembly protein FimT